MNYIFLGLSIFSLIVGVSLIIFILIILIKVIKKRKEEKKRQKQNKRILKFTYRIIPNQKILTIEKFFQIYDKLKKDEEIKVSSLKSSGIYIIHNTSKNTYYVGQSVNIVKRVNNHFTGKGNGDVYADFKYGHKFKIKLIRCKEKKLDEIEKYYITKYKSFDNGYNKNVGNGPS